MVDAAQHGKESPPALLLAFWCGDGHLPDAGGVYDQDYATYMRMIMARNIYNAVRTSKSAVGAQIHALPSGVKRIVKSLKDDGYM